jgi:hypothetical protein
MHQISEPSDCSGSKLRTAVYGPGDSLAVAPRRHVNKSTLFVLLRITRDPQLAQTRRLGGGGGQRVPRVTWVRPKIIPIDFGETIARAVPATNSIARLVQNFVRIPEALAALVESPSPAVLDEITRKL